MARAAGQNPPKHRHEKKAVAPRAAVQRLRQKNSRVLRFRLPLPDASGRGSGGGVGSSRLKQGRFGGTPASLPQRHRGTEEKCQISAQSKLAPDLSGGPRGVCFCGGTEGGYSSRSPIMAQKTSAKYSVANCPMARRALSWRSCRTASPSAGKANATALMK